MFEIDGDEKKVSVIIPAHNEEESIGEVVETVKGVDEVDEIVVVDDGSTDGTASKINNGAKIVRLDKNRGKGMAMKEGLFETRGDLLVFLDADLKNVKEKRIQKMIHALEENDFVVAKFDRRGGRVTELTAKPLLSKFFPEIDVEQPLSGQKAVHRKTFDKMDIPNNYGVDIAMLIDAHMNGADVGETYFGRLEHDMKTLDELTCVAEEVNETILEKAEEYGRIEIKEYLDD